MHSRSLEQVPTPIPAFLPVLLYLQGLVSFVGGRHNTTALSVRFWKGRGGQVSPTRCSRACTALLLERSPAATPRAGAHPARLPRQCSASTQLHWTHKRQILSPSRNCSPSTPLLPMEACSKAVFCLGWGKIKKKQNKLGGARIHGSHIFKNSLAGSRLRPEHACSGPVTLTQHAGSLRLLLPASSSQPPGTARRLAAPARPPQPLPEHNQKLLRTRVLPDSW